MKIIGIAVGALVLVWFAKMALGWFGLGLGAGRKYGNQIADHLGLSRNLFHTILEHGVDGPSLVVLGSLKALPVDRAAVKLAPSMVRGLMKLEKKFGTQPQIEEAKQAVTHVFVEWQAEQSS
jgi:hypothetical protein